MFNTSWRLFYDPSGIVDHVLSDRPNLLGTAVVELTTELTNTLRMLENPKKVIDDEMVRPGANISKSLLDTKIVALIPQLEDKIREFPNDAILREFYELLQKAWKRYLQIITNHTTKAFHLFGFQMNQDEDRETDGMQKYISLLTIKTAFATVLWQQHIPVMVRNSKSNNEAMILFYWYNVSSIDLDYEEERYIHYMTMEQEAKYREARFKLDLIKKERDDIVAFYKSTHDKLANDIRDMFQLEEKHALEMKENDPHEVIRQVDRLYATFQKIEEATLKQVNELNNEKIEHQYRLDPYPSGMEWDKLIEKEKNSIRKTCLGYIEANESEKDEHIMTHIIQRIDEYLEWLKGETEKKRDEIDALTKDEKGQDIYEYDVDDDNNWRLQRYTESILLYKFYSVRQEQISQFDKHIKDVMQALDSIPKKPGDLLTHFYNYVNTRYVNIVSSYNTDYTRLVDNLEEPAMIASKIREKEYFIQAYDGLTKWVNRIKESKTKNDARKALFMTTVDSYMKSFKKIENNSGKFVDEKETTARVNIKAISTERLIEELMSFSESIATFTGKAVKIIIQEQKELLNKSRVRLFQIAKISDWIDSVSISSDERWKLTSVHGVDSDDRLKFISFIHDSILSTQSNKPSLAAAYNMLRDFTFSDTSHSRANLDEIWRCILAIWKILIVTNPSDVVN